ncbi:hypothetical protein Pan44_17720 [Caulifigura coniformis]|uniref:Uncharacterized protein n=1 Tax=Caulifigura coniformis TaxID=2527983 RepID=A0A517SC94_9PLAN|nr:hypothetical protein [Caulifigura coniformis]QDT53749.1 hypothetical protein Pan44_17720 [Caulifigura coniformis]
MLRYRTRLFAGLIAAAFTSAAQAQFWPNSGACCGQAAPAPVPLAMNPCCMPQPQVCMQAIPQTVYRDVPVTEYRPVQKSVQVPVQKVVYEDQPVTVMRQVMQTKTCDVQSVSYQNVAECKQVCVNRGYWQTTMQPVPKMAPCQYDQRPTLLGELNRLGYATRMAFTPDFIPRRDYVPNMQMVNVQQNRVVAVPTVRQVSYNVATLVPEQTTQKVARVITEMESRTVTAMEPYTTTKRMAVGVQYQYAMVDSVTGTALAPSGTMSAANPTPADGPIPRRADNPNGESFKSLSNPTPKTEAEPTLAEPKGKVAAAPAPKTGPVIHTVGWRPSRESGAVAK